MTRKMHCLWALIVLLPALVLSPAFAEEVRLHGAASTVDRLIAPHKEAVEKATGFTLIVDRSSAGKGLKDLVDGACDAALTSAPLETTVQAAKAAGKDVDGSQLQMHVIKADEVVFVVHPANAVTRLSRQQVKDIHTGKISNWKEVGGKDLTITVYTDSLSSATRGLIKKSVLDDQEYVSNAIAVDKVAQINDVVTANEGGIGALGLGFVLAEKVKIVETDKVERPLGLITIGEPSEKVKKVIAAFREASR